MSNLVCFFISLFVSFGSCWAVEEALLSKADQFYAKGGEETSLLERQKNFNSALEIYLEIEQQNPSLTHSNALYEAIADSYFQLGEYAKAILYTYRALELEPHNPALIKNLQLAQEQIGLTPQHEKNTLALFLSFNGRLPLPKRYELFFITAVLTLALISLVLWFNAKWLRQIVFLFTALTALILTNIILSIYLIPLQGVLLKPTGLYREPNFNQPQLLPVPLMQGTKVRILDSAHRGTWIKVATPNDDIGYIPLFAIEQISSIN